MLLRAALESPGSRRRRVLNSILAVAGVATVDLLGVVRLGGRGGQTERREIRVKSALTVNRPPEHVYRFWRDLENLPRFMFHLESVQVAGDGRSHATSSRGT